MLRLAHIVNPFAAPPASDLYTAQPITFKSMLNARERAKAFVEVELVAACFAEDRSMVPHGFKETTPLERSVSDLQQFAQPLKLPLIADILERLYTESNAAYLIYTNVDIGLFPDFYTRVKEFIEAGHDAFIINRRRLPAVYTKVADLDAIYRQSGKKHPGFDCFVFHRSLFPQMRLEGICIGVPFIEISFSQNLFALAKNFKLYDEECLTFHIGEEIFKKRAPREYVHYNRKQFRRLVKELWPKMDLAKFPYAQKPWPLRFIRWGLHPCIPIKLALRLEAKRLGLVK